jgi:exopolysaccharide biosynthesis protein
VSKDGKVVIKPLGRPDADDWQVVSGNTMLVKNGEVVPHDNKVRHPRTVVGLNAAGNRLILLVVDGRKAGIAVGMNYDELAAEMILLGCKDA